MDNTERIDRYLHGAMDAAEKQAFEAEAASNTQLAEELALQRDMERFLHRRAHRDALQAQLRGMDSAYFREETPEVKLRALPRRRLLWIGVVAAAAALALFVLRPVLFGPTLYEQYAQYPSLSLAEKSASATTDWSKAEQAFNARDYAAAEPLLRSYVESFPEDMQARLFLGICQMESDRPDDARQTFRSFAQADASLRDYADWYLALSYLKTGDYAACRQVLEAVAPASAQYGKAKELLEKLK